MKTVRAPRKRPQQGRSQQTVDAILDAAAQLFGAADFGTVSTNAIAQHAGVSIGSLYQYFPNKLALLEALRERHIKGLWAEIGRACEDACTLPWPDALRSVVVRCSAYNAHHVALMVTLHRELPIHTTDTDRLALAQSTLRAQLRTFLEAHRASLKVSIDQALFVMPALGRGLFTSAAVEQPDAVRHERLVDDMMAIMLGYLS